MTKVKLAEDLISLSGKHVTITEIKGILRPVEKDHTVVVEKKNKAKILVLKSKGYKED